MDHDILWNILPVYFNMVKYFNMFWWNRQILASISLLVTLWEANLRTFFSLVILLLNGEDILSPELLFYQQPSEFQSVSQ